MDEGINLIKCDSIYLTFLGDNSNDVFSYVNSGK